MRLFRSLAENMAPVFMQTLCQFGVTGMGVTIFSVLDDESDVRARLLGFCTKNDLFHLSLTCKNLCDVCLYQDTVELKQGVPVDVLGRLYNKLSRLTIRDIYTTNRLLRSTATTTKSLTYNAQLAEACVRGVSPLGALRHVTSLHIRSEFFLPHQVRLVSNFMPELRHINLSGVRFTAGALTSLMKGLPKHVELLNISGVSDNSVIDFVFPLHLRSLNASNVYVGSSELQSFVKAIQKCTYLEELYEPFCLGAHDDVYSTLLESAPRLRRISASTMCTQLGELLYSRSSQLEHMSLRLSANPMVTISVLSRVTSAQHFPVLQSLHIKGGIDETAWVVPKIIQKAPRLQEVSMGGPVCMFYSHSFDVLNTTNNLRTLCVEGNFLSGAVGALVDVASSMPSLRRVVVKTYSHMSQADVERLFWAGSQECHVVLEDLSPIDKEN